MLTGVYTGAPPQSVRRLGELAELFASPEAITTERRDEAVYEIHGPLADPNDPPRLLHATTVLYPGDVAGEYFMTRGHFHTNPERGEFMLTLSGEGALLLMDRSGSAWSEPMEQGSVHDIDGRHAHRVVNTGDGPLIFLVVWMSDCGHDYESIRERGFGQRVSCSSNVHL
jgi:glucose-6-phosphate isomerase